MAIDSTGGLARVTQKSTSAPQFVAASALRMYLDRQFDELCNCFLAVLDYYNQNTLFNVTPADLKYLNDFVQTFLFLFSQDDFAVPDKYISSFIELNHVISNVVAMSSFKTTDAFLENHQFNFARVLALYSARNKTRIDTKLLFDTNARRSPRCGTACMPRSTTRGW